MKDLFNEATEEEVATAEAEAAADVQTTALADNEAVYHDGAIVIGTTAIFNDEALTEPTPDADYTTADDQILTVAGGICTALGPDPNAVAETPAVATLKKELAAAQAQRATAEAEAARLRKLKPPVPTARATRADGAQAPNPKEKPAARANAADAGTL